MKTAIILTAISILCIFGIAILYPMYRKRREQKKLQVWRKGLKEGHIAINRMGKRCEILTKPDINGDCEVKIGLYGITFYNIDKLYPEGGENGKGS